MWAEKRIQELAGSRHGLVTRPGLIGLTVSDREIGQRIEDGRLTILYPGVYYVDSTPATWKTQVLAAVMAAGPDALASHRCAAVLWGFDAIYGRPIEVTVPYDDSPEPAGVILHRSRRPNPASYLDAIPITSPERTLLDIAPRMPWRVMERAARSAVRSGLTTVDKMALAVQIHGGRGVAGTRKMRTVIRLVADDASGSIAEIDLAEIIREAPIPQPIQQLQIRLPDGSNAYPDFAWADRMRIVEADGFEAHGSPEQLQHDLRRQNQLMDLGWELRRFTAREIRENPVEVRAQIIDFVLKPFCEG